MDGSAGAGEDSLRLEQMRAVDHPAADRQHAGVGLGGERGDDRLGVGDFGRRGREGGVDDRDLVGVDGELAGEAFATPRRAASSSSPSSSLKSANTPSTGWTPAATAPARHSERASL